MMGSRDGRLAQDRPVRNILVIDDLPQLAGLVEKYVGLVEHKCLLRWAATLSEAEYAIRFRPPHLVLLDLHMPRDEWLPGPHMLREFGQLKPLAFCRRIVTDPKLAGAVVVLVSVDDQIAALSKAPAHMPSITNTISPSTCLSAS
jgi:CheY-like chemotaxis protein